MGSKSSKIVYKEFLTITNNNENWERERGTEVEITGKLCLNK